MSLLDAAVQTDDQTEDQSFLGNDAGGDENAFDTALLGTMLSDAVELPDPEIVPEGIYRLNLDALEFKVNAEGKPQYWATLTPLDVNVTRPKQMLCVITLPSKEDFGDPAKKNFMLDQVKFFMRGFDISQAQLVTVAKTKTDAALRGKVARAKVTVGEYNGEATNNVATFNVKKK